MTNKEAEQDSTDLKSQRVFKCIRAV